MKLLITGISGFAGSHLADFLLAQQPSVEVHGTVSPRGKNSNIAHLVEKLVLHDCDIDNKVRVKEVIADAKPDSIVHLAAQSYVSSSWENPERTLHTNIIGQSNVFEAVRALRSAAYDPTIIIACSSEEYGVVDSGTPLIEDAPLKPQSPYALSKVAQDYMGFQYWKAYGMKVVRLRAFNHTGPRRDPVFGVSGFCRKVAEIEKGLRPPRLEIRDLTAVRDFTDVRDVGWRSGHARRERYTTCARGKAFRFSRFSIPYCHFPA
jgi:GDP-4-dehydro-6-deoxy-D-mannose reductase